MALGQRRAGGRLNGDAAQLGRPLVAGCLVGEEGEGDTAEAGRRRKARRSRPDRDRSCRTASWLQDRSPSGATAHGEHRTQRVAGARIGGGFLDRLRNRQAERTLAVGIGGQGGAPGVVRSVGLAKTSAPRSASSSGGSFLLIVTLTMKTRTGRPNICRQKRSTTPTGRRRFRWSASWCRPAC